MSGNVRVTKQIIAIITLHPERVGGSVPIFHARSAASLEEMARYISRVTGGMVHELEEGTYFIVLH
ncbi:MAG: hypothetical protein PHV61_02810 [Limnochordia bacterium]|jgi:hypothetical protein|nr:hypothetical protein [Limnochordia bacterium]MDD2629089.1 hypothetical protein [Limnochordia bacterium]MDD4518153.1 hypothetical protein [Limnochordia bacterium]